MICHLALILNFYPFTHVYKDGYVIMNIYIKNKFLNTSERYLKITERDTNTSNNQNAADLSLLEKKMLNRFFHNSKSVLLDKIG